MSSAANVVRRYTTRKIATKLRLGPGRKDERASESLAKIRLKSRNRGDLESAIISAGYHAKKLKQTMYVYQGNSYMHTIWQVSERPGHYLNPVNNTGEQVVSVTTDLTVTFYDVVRTDE
jgi:hypothetical protein